MAIKGLDLEFDLITEVSYAQCLTRTQVCGLFFDQAGTEIKEKLGVDDVIGWYGYSAVVAAAYGIPTIAHLSQQAFVQARQAGKDIEERCAIINTPLGAEGIRETILWYFNLPSHEKKRISLRTRAWVEEFHSYRVVARELARVYDSVLAEKG